MVEKHTPGPWKTIDGLEIWPTTGDANNVELCRMVGGEPSTFYTAQQAAANGRFIVAACNAYRNTKALETAVALLDAMVRGGERHTPQSLQVVREALGEHEGKGPNS